MTIEVKEITTQIVAGLVVGGIGVSFAAASQFFKRMNQGIRVLFDRVEKLRERVKDLEDQV